MIGKINIFGPIGKYEEGGEMKGVSLLDVISQVKSLPQDTQVIEVHIASPGGYVDEGDNIYNYLESLKKQYVVNTVQDGNIASIATKLFLVGQDRKADQNFDFMIHNPWIDPGPGDAAHHEQVLEGLLAEEEKLRKFYSKSLNISEEGLKPLMDQETTLTANQLLTLGFATSLKTNKPVLAMKKEGKKSETLLSRATALLAKIKGEKINALDVSLMDGTTLTVDAPNEDSMIGATATIDGSPAPDGDYVAMPDPDDGDSQSGDTITVKGGVVTAVTEPAAAPSAKNKKQEVASEERFATIEKSISNLTDAVSALIEHNKASASKSVEDAVAKAEEKAEAKIKALRDEIGTTHTPRKESIVYAKSVDKNKTDIGSLTEGITGAMERKRQERKEKLNRN